MIQRNDDPPQPLLCGLLELAKEGKIVIRQDEIFSPIQIKRADRDG